MIHDVPLLAENALGPLYDLVVVVDASPETQLERLVRLRGMTEADARARMAAQATREKRLGIADVVIDNDVPLEELEGAFGRFGRISSAGRRPARNSRPGRGVEPVQ